MGSSKKISTAHQAAAAASGSESKNSGGGIIVGSGLQSGKTGGSKAGQWQSSGLTEVGKPLKVVPTKAVG